MKVNYDAGTDTLTVVFRDVPVAESDEDEPGVILDYDSAGNLVSVEALARRGDHPGLVHVISAMEACESYRPWHDKASGKTFLKPDSGKWFWMSSTALSLEPDAGGVRHRPRFSLRSRARSP